MVRILIIVCLIFAVVGGVWWWHNYHSGNVYDGSVVRRDAAMENGTTTLENGQNLGDAHPTPSHSDAPGTINGVRVDANGRPIDSYDLGTQTTPITQDPYAATGPYGQPPANTPYDSSAPPNTSHTPNTPNTPRISYDATRPPYAAPATDSQAPNAPDGLRFGGDGAYQWYRQGNLTYRVDTRSGRSCVIYATLEEWRKPFVYRNGCHAS